MKIAFIDPQGSVSGFNTGIAYLAAILKKDGHQVRVVDFNNDPKRVAERIASIFSFAPQVVGFSVKAGTVAAADRLAGHFRHKGIRVIIGGPGITCAEEKALAAGYPYDAFFFGESEDSLPRYARHCSEKYVYGTACPAGELDALPFPDYSVFDTVHLIRDSYPLVTSRGCPYGCTYCSVRKFSGILWRGRCADSVVEELAMAKTELGIRHFNIADDNFTFDTSRAKEICRRLIRMRPGLTWGCTNGIRADRVDEELLRLMKEAGCKVVWFGIESLDEELFTSIDKGEKLSDVTLAVRLAQKAGLYTCGFFIAGLPGSTYERDSLTLRKMRSLGLHEALWSMATPYPHTKFWDWAVAHARWLGDYRRVSFYKLPTSIIETPEYPARLRLKMFYRGNLAGYSYSCFFPRTIRARDILRFLYYVLRYDPLHAFVHAGKILFGRYHRTYIREFFKRVR
jgi:radical SAM superfamily enzyme YgiQ (UPF0313 family)